MPRESPDAVSGAVCDSRRYVKRKRPLTSGPVDGAEIRRLLTQGRPTLVPAVRERILSSGAEAIPILIEVLLDETLAMEDGPGKGYAPIHAARLLGERGATEAIEPLLKRMVDTTWDEFGGTAGRGRSGAQWAQPALTWGRCQIGCFHGERAKGNLQPPMRPPVGLWSPPALFMTALACDRAPLDVGDAAGSGGASSSQSQRTSDVLRGAPVSLAAPLL
jgi:hypothetical protein